MNGMKKMLYGNIINRIKEFLLKNLPEITYILFLATFLERFSYFLIIPFLSIYLAQNYHLSGLEIGLVVSTFAITSLFMSFIAAPFIDKIDKKVIIFVGLFLSAMSFLCFPIISKCLFFVIFALVNSIGSSLLSPTYKTILALSTDKMYKEFVFNIRYYLVNISATLAPLVSVQLQFLGVHIICYIIFMAYCINFNAFIYAFYVLKIDLQNKNNTLKVDISRMYTTFRDDRAYSYLIIGLILFVFGYTVMTSILPQYFAIYYKNLNASKLFALLLSVNGITVITCQFFVYVFSKRASIKTAMITGAFLLPVSLFALGIIDDVILKCISMVVFTLGEMLVFTMMDIRIDALSNDNFKGTYSSLAGLQNLGALLAPIIGGVCLDIIQQGWIIFGLLSIITSFSILFFYKSNKIA
ncbi:MFS transporter [Staphylococcus capitis]|uniref:MFS transporter n=1 Tax=Staphylococcus capitis TaxID=29388 RepID=UPI0030C29BAF